MLFLCGKHKQYHGRKQLDRPALTDYNKDKSPKGRANFMKENRKLLSTLKEAAQGRNAERAKVKNKDREVSL